MLATLQSAISAASASTRPEGGFAGPAAADPVTLSNTCVAGDGR